MQNGILCVCALALELVTTSSSVFSGASPRPSLVKTSSGVSTRARATYPVRFGDGKGFVGWRSLPYRKREVVPCVLLRLVGVHRNILVCRLVSWYGGASVSAVRSTGARAATQALSGATAHQLHQAASLVAGPPFQDRAMAEVAVASLRLGLAALRISSPVEKSRVVRWASGWHQCASDESRNKSINTLFFQGTLYV